MGVLGWIVLGLIAGAIAKLIMPGDDPGGIIVTMLLGIVGAVIGGFLGSRFFGIGLRSFWSLRRGSWQSLDRSSCWGSTDSSSGGERSRADHHPVEAGRMDAGYTRRVSADTRHRTRPKPPLW
jgi:uncharacterized membrane protein YeaQ/YmgE (transglycosylase-associated protein family)